jgi:class 3 adenylate cyclase
MILGYLPILLFKEMSDLKQIHRELDIEKRKKKIEKATIQCDQLLHNILPKKVVCDLKKKAEIGPQLFTDVAVLVSDIVGFTNMCSHTSATQIVSALTGLFARFDDQILAFGVEKVKTIGDSYLGMSS